MYGLVRNVTESLSLTYAYMLVWWVNIVHSTEQTNTYENRRINQARQYKQFNRYIGRVSLFIGHVLMHYVVYVAEALVFLCNSCRNSNKIYKCVSGLVFFESDWIESKNARFVIFLFEEKWWFCAIQTITILLTVSFVGNATILIPYLFVAFDEKFCFSFFDYPNQLN